MREPLRDKERLEHILAAIERVIRYTSGKSFNDLEEDPILPLSFIDNHSEVYGSTIGTKLRIVTHEVTDRDVRSYGSLYS